MVFIFLSILCSVTIGNLLQYFSKDNHLDIMTVFLGNYFFASLFSYMQKGSGTLTFGLFELIFGFITGFFFLFNFFILQRNIKTNGLSLSIGVMRVAVVIPTVMSVIFFADRIGLVNALGVLVIIAAFFFIMETQSLRNFLWICLLFVVAGFTDSTMKIYSELGKSDQTPFIFILFTSAFLITLLWKMVHNRKFVPKYLLFGIVLGVPNQLSTRFFMMGLDRVPAPIAYPLTASSIVVFSILTDIFIWKKMFTMKQRIALGLLVFGILMLNLR